MVKSVPYSTNVLKGKVLCAHCGYPMHWHKQKNYYYWFRCESQWKYAKDACFQVSVKESDITASILATLCQQSEVIQLMDINSDDLTIVNSAETELQGINRKLPDNGRFLKSLYENLACELITTPEYTQMKADYQAKIEALSNRADEIRAELRETEARKEEYGKMSGAVSVVVRDGKLSAEIIDRLMDKLFAEMDMDAAVIELVDNGYSGTNYERPAVQELLEFVRTGKVNCIVVKDFSRFGRNAIETGYLVERVFLLYGTHFISVSDNYDSAEHADDTGGLDVAFKFLIHEQYSRDLSRKIKSSAHERMRCWEHISKNCVYGYMKTKDNKLEIDESAADTVRLIYGMAADGKSLAQIIARLYADKIPTPSEYKQQTRQVLVKSFSCLWYKSQVQSMLSDERYIGTYTAGKTKRLEVGSSKAIDVDESEWSRIPDHHSTIIDKALFAVMRDKINQKGEPLRKRKLGTWQRYKEIRSPLQGKVVCGYCEHTMKLSSTKNAAFHCDYARAAPDAPCHRLAKLREMLLDVIKKRATDMLTSSEENPNNFEQKQKFEHQISERENKKRALYERFVRDELDAEEYKTAKIAPETQLERLNRAYVAHYKESTQMTAIIQSCDELRKLTEQTDSTLTRPVVDLLIEKVWCFLVDERRSSGNCKDLGT